MTKTTTILGVQPLTRGDKVRALRDGIGEGAAGFDLSSMAILWLVMGGVLAVFAFRQRKWLARLFQVVREEHLADKERLLRRQAEGQGSGRRVHLAGKEEVPLAEPMSEAELLRLTPGTSLSWIESGVDPVTLRVVAPGSKGLIVETAQDQPLERPRSQLWIARRDEGGRRLSLFACRVIESAGAPSTEDNLTPPVRVAPDGPAWQFHRFGRTPVEMPGVLVPLKPDPRNPGEPVEVISLGIGSAEFLGRAGPEVGSPVLLKAALPSTLESLQIETRVKSRRRDDAGQDITELVFEITPASYPERIAAALAEDLLAADLVSGPDGR